MKYYWGKNLHDQVTIKVRPKMILFENIDDISNEARFILH